MNFLSGKKTYIVGACGIFYAVGGYFSGHIDLQTALSALFLSLGLFGLRSGISTEIESIVSAIAQSKLPPQQ